jgi:outer membrane protein OmpA-like peptidoglycan-associated protein
VTRQLLFIIALGGATLGVAETRSQAPGERIDYLTFAQGALPVRVGGSAPGSSIEHAIQATDGNHGTYALSLKSAAADADTEFVYRLPAPTTFDRFAVPGITETPSPSQTFSKQIEVFGSAESDADGFQLLASATLKTHAEAGQVTELTMAAKVPVRFVKVRLVGGIDVQRPLTFFEFSEIIGNGTQEAVPVVDHFSGAWQGRGVAVTLRQSGAAVRGCYDTGGTLEGTVTGSVLRATGVDPLTKVPSAFLLTVVDDDVLLGLRSTNGAPFRVYTGNATAAGSAKCPAPPPPVLGCGAVIHGITFDFDSADIRPESEPVLAALFDGLRADTSASIVIEGHTSSEGTEAYNQTLSERRAAAVVADLVTRGIPQARLTATGIGEARPIARNDDETGRSMNRRVEVRCK